MIKQQTLSQLLKELESITLFLQYYLIKSVAYFKNAEIKRINVKRQQQKKLIQTGCIEVFKRIVYYYLLM